LVSSLIKNIVRDIIIGAVGLAVIWISLTAYLGAANPFYVVQGESMYPELSTGDIIVITGNQPFEDVKIGDIIVFDRPEDHDRVMFSRVVAVVDDDPKSLRTKGDNNQRSIVGSDYPITEKEYIGTVIHHVPQVGYIFQNFPIGFIIIIAVIVGVIVVVEIQISKNKKKTPKATPQRKTFGAKQPKKRRTAGSPVGASSSADGPSTYEYFECPNCHEPSAPQGKLGQNLDGTQFCSKCGWDSED
jgi:signal peptidase